MLKVVLGVSGGIAAYKAAEIVRRLVDSGVEVQVMMTQAATEFITPLTLSVLSRRPVIASLWDASSGAVDHIELARKTDVLAIAPATANCLAKQARGIGDDVLSTYALAHRGALVAAPAMNTWMWTHDATQQNIEILKRRGAVIVPPESGELACGDQGAGRMAAPEKIVEAILEEGRQSRELAGRHILVTAGPTREPVDPVRFLSNRSSGKMGYALARAALKRGARVTLVSGPVNLQPPAGVRVIPVERTVEMQEAVLAAFSEADALIMAAAPADFCIENRSPEKIKRGKGAPQIRLTLAPDILASVRERKRPGQVIAAFAAETSDLVANAARKLSEKGADLLVGNDVSRAGVGFDADDNEVVLLTARPDGGADRQDVPRSSKTVIAERIVSAVTRVLDAKCPRVEIPESLTR
ncbi:MAG: Coenzyme A biosynthesis bifunctional protein CoaBC [Thermoanaerobaculia bacterium]|nr:Coenzyme A biosynthesis bifunctional protein CoaBC [Thermoanaerobaculia bacterium]